ncbi:MAG: lipopolysaccharide biosynthesis protein [Acidimicrobiales bacterium]
MPNADSILPDPSPESTDHAETGIRRHFRRGGLANDTAWSALHDVSQLLVMTGTFLLLSTRLTVDDYGRYAGVYGIVGPVGGLTWSGITLAVLQRRLRERDDVEKVARDFFLLTLCLGVAAVTVATTIGGRVIPHLAITTILAVMVAELLANAVNMVSIAMVQAEKGFAPATRLRMVTLGIRIAVVLLLTATGNLTIPHLGIGYTIGFSVYLVVILVVVLPRHGIRFALGRPSPGTGRTTASISLPIAAGVLQQDGDKTVLNAYHFPHTAGLYAAAFRVVSMGLMPLRALEGAAFQRFLPHDDSARNEHTRRAARFSVLALGLSIVLAIGILVCRPIVHVLIGDKFRGAEDMIPWLLPFLPLTAVSNAPSNGLLGLGKLGVRAAIYTTSAIVSLTLYIALIPVFHDHWKGAVAGTIAGEAYLAIAGWTTLFHFQRKHNETLDQGTPDDDALDEAELEHAVLDVHTSDPTA